ncbi:MAG: ABC transporter substrate-binding protein [Sporichthyaceae bacterium]
MTLRPRRLALAALSLALLAGCGSRLDGADIVAAGTSDTVALTPESLEALRDAGQAVAVSQAPVDEVADVAAPLVPAPADPPGARPRAGAAVAAPAATRTAQNPGRVPAAAKAGPAAAAPAAQCARPLEQIALGHIGTFSGVAGPITASAVTTMAAWAQDVNSRGGLACHPVRVFTRDDGADPAKAASLAKEMVERQKVVAFVATLTLMPAGFVQTAAKLGVPVIGGGVGQDAWFTTPGFYPDIARGDDLIVGLLRAGADRGKKKLGLLYCVEATACGEVTKKVKDSGAKAAGVELVYETAVSVTQTDYTAQCLNAQKAGVDLLGLAVDGASMTRVARSCAAIGYRPLLTTASFLIGTQQSRDEGLRSFGVVTAAGTAPWFQKDRPGLTEYQRALARWAPNLVADGASIGTWTSAKLFEAVIAKVADRARTGALTPELIESGAKKIRNEDLGGLTGPLDFTSDAKRAVGSGCVFFQYLGKDGWSAPNGSKPVCLRR